MTSLKKIISSLNILDVREATPIDAIEKLENYDGVRHIHKFKTTSQITSLTSWGNVVEKITTLNGESFQIQIENTIVDNNMIIPVSFMGWTNCKIRSDEGVDVQLTCIHLQPKLINEMYNEEMFCEDSKHIFYFQNAMLQDVKTKEL